jgi:hypothetical protein
MVAFDTCIATDACGGEDGPGLDPTFRAEHDGSDPHRQGAKEAVHRPRLLPAALVEAVTVARTEEGAQHRGALHPVLGGELLRQDLQVGGFDRGNVVHDPVALEPAVVDERVVEERVDPSSLQAPRCTPRTT